MFEEIKKKIEEYGLTAEQYEACLSDAYMKCNHTLDIDWQEIIEKYNLDMHYDTLRKATQTIFGGAFVSEYYREKQQELNNEDSYIQQIRAEKQELYREKQRLFDERNQLRKDLREKARTENDLKYLEGLISNKSFLHMPINNFNKSISSDKDMIVCLSDFHLGLSNKNVFGCFDSEIAADRLLQYYSEIKRISELHNCKNAYVLFLGDLINGEIHLTSQLENRESLSEQIVVASELLSDFAYKLSSIFENVYVNGVAGNHSRTSYKDEVLRGNRLDNLIPWYMKAALKHLNNIYFVDNENYDSTIGKITVHDKEYVFVHGDYDQFNESGISKLVMMIGHKPAGVIMGHMHHNSFDDINDIKVIRSGSFSGTGDDYCITKRLYGQPSQMLAILDNGNIECCYPINFK